MGGGGVSDRPRGRRRDSREKKKATDRIRQGSGRVSREGGAERSRRGDRGRSPRPAEAAAARAEGRAGRDRAISVGYRGYGIASRGFAPGRADAAARARRALGLGRGLEVVVVVGEWVLLLHRDVEVVVLGGGAAALGLGLAVRVGVELVLALLREERDGGRLGASPGGEALRGGPRVAVGIRRLGRFDGDPPARPLRRRRRAQRGVELALADDRRGFTRGFLRGALGRLLGGRRDHLEGGNARRARQLRCARKRERRIEGTIPRRTQSRSRGGSAATRDAGDSGARTYCGARLRARCVLLTARRACVAPDRSGLPGALSSLQICRLCRNESRAISASVRSPLKLHRNLPDCLLIQQRKNERGQRIDFTRVNFRTDRSRGSASRVFAARRFEHRFAAEK